MRKSVVVALVVVILLGALGYGGWRAYRYVYERVTPERCEVLVPDADPTTLTREQAVNASIIVAASVERGLPEQAAVIALATAYQESGLRNLDYGDRDSLGLFQQRPSYGWGTEEELQDPWYSSNRFYEELVKFDNWETTDVNDIAQKVQRSGHPEAYRKHETNARAVAAALRGSAPASLSCLSFDDPTASDPASFERVLGAFGDTVTTSQDGTTLVITATDEATLWAAAQHVVAHGYDAGVLGVVVGDREWKLSSQGWHEVRTPAPGLTATVTLAG